ncbi:MAG: SGNH/GDSL hydrolase family protein [Chlamydiae bacterium]|nr:SGNH/GDSL hydrolase family protein [Chlamydiota bacterium]
MSQKHPNFKNPIIAAQTFDFPFVADTYQGHTMPSGREFVGENAFIPIEELIKNLKGTNKKVVLNIGDSSTSGWDSNIVTQNRERIAQNLPLLSAFFQYKTYSDCLRALIKDEYVVVNAGVPAHTSLQGSRRLKLLFDRFNKENIPIHWVTVYYGNNDSVWDHNRQDKEWVGRNMRAFIEKLTKPFKKSSSSVVTRVLPDDYQIYMKEIIRTCQNNNANVLVIEPITPIYWKPGTRVLNEDLERRKYPGSDQVYQLLDDARALWAQAIKQTHHSDFKEVALLEVREKDFVVPRIKRSYVNILRSLVQEMDVWYIKVDLDRNEDDICYFIDYCHPIEKANQLIANKLAEVISGKVTRKYDFTMKKNLSTFSKEVEQLNKLPTDHYTLY